MNEWRKAIVGSMLGFIVGWFVAKNTTDRALARCHDAVQVLTKGASMEQIDKSSKLLRGE